MATSIKDAETTPKDHNIAATKSALMEKHRDLIPLEAEKKRINDEIKQIMDDVKALGIDKGAFKLARRLWNLEKGEERNEAMHDILVACSALEINAQGVLFPDGD